MMRHMAGLVSDYERWLGEVREALASLNMNIDDWQRLWRFDFEREFDSGVGANAAAMKANQFWWFQQNKSLDRDCRRTSQCWLPRNHQGECQPIDV